MKYVVVFYCNYLLVFSFSLYNQSCNSFRILPGESHSVEPYNKIIIIIIIIITIINISLSSLLLSLLLLLLVVVVYTI